LRILRKIFRFVEINAMRKTALVICLLAVSNCIFSQQDTTTKKINFIVKADVFLPVLGFIDQRHYGSITFETCFKKRHSIQLTGIIGILKNENSRTFGTGESDLWQRKEIRFQFIPEYKYFLKNKKDYKGFYCGAYFKYTYFYLEATDIANYDPVYSRTELKQHWLGAGPIIGYQNYIRKNLVIDILAGFGYRYVISNNVIMKVGKDLNSSKLSSPDLRLAINIGYKF